MASGMEPADAGTEAGAGAGAEVAAGAERERDPRDGDQEESRPSSTTPSPKERSSKELFPKELSSTAPSPSGLPSSGPSSSDPPPKGVLAVRTGLWATVILCVAASLVHVTLVFLHVAPANTVSKRFSPQVEAWVFPFFEQNWRLFAPEPESVNRTIEVRTARTGRDGTFRVSGWFDLTALDNAAVAHQPFPSHTAQNLLRRAWSSYVDTHGGDDTDRGERARMMRTYLSNIAAERVAAHRGDDADYVQLRVVTRPIPAPGAATDGGTPKPSENRLLPWWKVPSHGA
ncbi:DUF5819 family protein [Streptomyces sp. NPDC086091]|uniref:DUF5819 family protein n=1 Tax=Streptomyces sp. NPDC086091 TaxID=3365751 RepID=UPI003824E8E7